ncbi:hypothetical protein CB1_001512035 [Camelus ferus]|nr:hypothetical protein CB1_001512035 [Camelus ferus]
MVLLVYDEQGMQSWRSREAWGLTTVAWDSPGYWAELCGMAAYADCGQMCRKGRNRKTHRRSVHAHISLQRNLKLPNAEEQVITHCSPRGRCLSLIRISTVGEVSSIDALKCWYPDLLCAAGFWCIQPPTPFYTTGQGHRDLPKLRHEVLVT